MARVRAVVSVVSDYSLAFLRFLVTLLIAGSRKLSERKSQKLTTRMEFKESRIVTEISLQRYQKVGDSVKSAQDDAKARIEDRMNLEDGKVTAKFAPENYGALASDRLVGNRCSMHRHISTLSRRRGSSKHHESSRSTAQGCHRGRLE
ncbi:hypothetical protein B0T10DRAFT_456931 [Thelonectria olida]|uniref:Uncharacterized protein n=1 Tax=Thelonectria olida TaxID=1576542 RepID=A0A9P8WAN5_9HYPO|nr:hypothetical protein B0T10DRAFT_456931 [Thelonectria olida]